MQEETRKEEIARLAALSNTLKTLTQYPEWQIFGQEMARAEQGRIEDLINAPRIQHDEIRGFIQGMRYVLAYPMMVEASYRSVNPT